MAYFDLLKDRSSKKKSNDSYNLIFGAKKKGNKKPKGFYKNYNFFFFSYQ